MKSLKITHFVIALQRKGEREREGQRVKDSLEKQQAHLGQRRLRIVAMLIYPAMEMQMVSEDKS